MIPGDQLPAGAKLNFVQLEDGLFRVRPGARGQKAECVSLKVE